MRCPSLLRKPTTFSLFLWHPANAKILKRGQRLVVFRQSSSYVQPSSGWPGDVPVIQGCPPKGCLFFTTPLMRQTFLLTSSTLLHTSKRATSRVFTEKAWAGRGWGVMGVGRGDLKAATSRTRKTALCHTQSHFSNLHCSRSREGQAQAWRCGS